MRPSLFLVAALIAPAAAVAFAACSSSGSAPSVGPLQPLGAACDETLANACAPAATGCSANVCTSGICTQVLVSEGNPSCGDAGALPPTNSLCTSSADCDAGVCGYLAGGGCTVTGVCVVPEGDASLPAPACGCNGLPDPYVASGFAGAPASSAFACSDGGIDDAAADADAASSVDSASDAGSADAADAAHSADAGDAAEVGDGAPE